MKSVLLCMTVLSLLTLSSCGKSKDTKSAPPVAKVATTSTPAPDGAPVPTADSTAPTVVGGSQAAPTIRPGTLAGAPTGTLAGQTGSGVTSSPTGTVPRANSGAAPTLRPGSSTTAPSANGSQSSEIINTAVGLNFDEAEAVKTGGKTKDLNYTSAGRDGLMAEFKTYAKKVSADQQKLNQNLASAIVSAKLVKSAGNMGVEITVDEFGKLQTYKMKAVTEGNKMVLSSAGVAGDLEFQGGFLKCLDLDGSCDNAYAKIKLSGAYTRIIFRNSYADNSFVIYAKPNAPAPNLNFDLWNSYISNKGSGASSAQKIDTIRMSSYEIVNGKSAMGVLVLTQDLDMVGLSVPLVAADQGTKTSATASKITDFSKNDDLAALAASRSQKLARALSSATVVANNGLGQLKLQLEFSADKADSKIWMVLSRVQTSTLNVIEVQKFEATLKAF